MVRAKVRFSTRSRLYRIIRRARRPVNLACALSFLNECLEGCGLSALSRLYSKQRLLDCKARAGSILRRPPHLGGNFTKIRETELDTVADEQGSLSLHLAAFVGHIPEMHLDSGSIGECGDGREAHAITLASLGPSVGLLLELHSPGSPSNH